MKVKLTDIAEKMGISTAAVSMAINNKEGVSEETRLKVLEVAEELGYKIRKKSIKEPETKRFIKLLRIRKHGLVVMETDFFAAVISGIEEQCKKRGYELLISNIQLDTERPKQLADEFHNDVDGMIALCTELDEEDVQAFKEMKCPLVILDNKFEFNIDTVLINNQKAVRQGVRYLHDNGHRQIGYLKSNTHIYNFGSRYRSYCVALDMLGLITNEQAVIELEPTIQGAHNDMIKYIEENGVENFPTAFLADNDNIALGAVNAMQEKGIKIPEDISVVGIDDMPFCPIVSPKLTTIKIFKEEIGRHAVKMLLDQINEESECSKKTEIDTMLIERDSVKTLL